MSYQSSIIIQELSASGDTQGRQLILSGSALPFMGSEWAMKLVAPTTWYPGNGDEGTQQVMGPQEMPSKWSGDWRRTMISGEAVTFIDENGNTVSVVDPIDLWNITETMARGGARLRVTWMVVGDSSGSNGRVVREGRMTELHFKPIRIQDIEWEITFEWMSRGSKTLQKVSDARAPTLAANSAAFLNKLNELNNAALKASLQQFKPGQLTLGQIEALANYPTDLTDSLARQLQQITSQVGDLVNIAKAIKTQPAQVQNRATDLGNNTTAQVNNFQDALSQRGPEQLTRDHTVADVIRAHKTFGTTADSARALATVSQAFTTSLTTQIQSASSQGRINPGRLGPAGQVDSVYLVKTGDTPQSISQKFYKTPDHAVDILRANKMSWYTPTLLPGKVLFIPALPTNSASQGV